ncbi:MAG: NADH-ubiquinone oxidoreductase-F iron-sulfur binding region domain-containing protein [Saccharofermentanales bacterium]
MTMQIIPTNYPQNMLSGGLVDGNPTFSALEYANQMSGADLIRIVAENRLRGRSGLAQPVSNKWQLCAAQETDNKLVVVNTIDGDPFLPAAATLLAKNPVGVIEGVLIAARAVGATDACICVDETDDETIAALTDLLRELQEAGRLNGCTFELTTVPAKYVIREDTALLAALEGRPIMSGLTPPMPAEKGFRGRPTLVHHAETFAQVAALFRQAARGEKMVQTRLIGLAGDLQKTGICEVTTDLSLRTVFAEIGGGMPEGKKFKFLQAGGPSGFLFAEDGLDIVLNDEAFEASGRWLVNPSIVVRDEATCVVDYVKQCADFAEKAACGKCVMGREGTWQLREFVSDMTTGKSKNDDPAMIDEISQSIHTGALCPVCRSAGAPVQSALEIFASEFDLHMRRRRCPTLVCNKYVTFHILPEKCTGCGECLPQCPVHAIAGDDGLIHVIDQDICNYCGICETVCRSIAQAVARAGLVKPQTPTEPIPVGTFKRRAGGLGGLRRR